MEGDRAGRCCTRCMRIEQQVNLHLQTWTAWAPMQRGNAGG
jgi:hypothetical protein